MIINQFPFPHFIFDNFLTEDLANKGSSSPSKKATTPTKGMSLPSTDEPESKTKAPTALATSPAFPTIQLNPLGFGSPFPIQIHINFGK